MTPRETPTTGNRFKRSTCNILSGAHVFFLAAVHKYIELDHTLYPGCMGYHCLRHGNAGGRGVGSSTFLSSRKYPNLKHSARMNLRTLTIPHTTPTSYCFRILCVQSLWCPLPTSPCAGPILGHQPTLHQTWPINEHPRAPFTMRKLPVNLTGGKLT